MSALRELDVYDVLDPDRELRLPDFHVVNEATDVDDVVGVALSWLTDELCARGYVNYIAPIDADVICHYTELGCPDDEYPVFPVGFRRKDDSYRAFAVCGVCYRVVFEL